MTIASRSARPLGTMVAYGFEGRDFGDELALAHGIGASHLEMFPAWSLMPDPAQLKVQVADSGLTIHSVHGCWGSTTIQAPRVDLGSLDESTQAASREDIRRCLDWTARAGGTFLVVHPGGYSSVETTLRRREALGSALSCLADHAKGAGVVVCVENMPPGVHPGSRMHELRELLEELDREELGLALDTGHANISADAAGETLAAGSWLRTTHVHDNDGRHDSHWPPGQGIVDWVTWRDALDRIDYRGPIMLECVKILRRDPSALSPEFRSLLARLIGDAG